MSIFKNGVAMDSLETWEAHAGPKSPDQWVDGRSAKETARAWLEAGAGNLPREVASVLETHPAFGALETWEAEPEVKLPFDKFSGETRNSDLVIFGKDRMGSVLIAVEAKADEPFSDTIGDTLAAALERKLKSSESNGIARVEQLASALFGPRRKGEPSLKGIRYQLLTACAGALCEGQRRDCNRALMLVQEFVTAETNDRKHAQNATDLNAFIKRISHGSVEGLQAGEIVGPFEVPGMPLLSESPPLFIGKVSRNLRDSGA
jgi:hypothetical protein